MNASRIQPPSSRWLRPSNGRVEPKPGSGEAPPFPSAPPHPTTVARACTSQATTRAERGAARDGLRPANGRSQRRISNVAAVVVSCLAEREASQARGAVSGCGRLWAAVSGSEPLWAAEVRGGTGGEHRGYPTGLGHFSWRECAPRIWQDFCSSTYLVRR